MVNIFYATINFNLQPYFRWNARVCYIGTSAEKLSFFGWEVDFYNFGYIQLNKNTDYQTCRPFLIVLKESRHLQTFPIFLPKIFRSSAFVLTETEKKNGSVWS